MSAQGAIAQGRVQCRASTYLAPPPGIPEASDPLRRDESQRGTLQRAPCLLCTY